MHWHEIVIDGEVLAIQADTWRRDLDDGVHTIDATTWVRT